MDQQGELQKQGVEMMDVEHQQSKGVLSLLTVSELTEEQTIVKGFALSSGSVTKPAQATNLCADRSFLSDNVFHWLFQ